MAEITHRFDVDKPLREGYLFKEGGSTKSWHKRYFALYPGVLVYYYKFSYYKKDREKGNLKASCMRACDVLVLSSVLGFTLVFFAAQDQ